MSQKQDTTRAATDVPEFIGELDGGMLEHALSVCLSEVASSVVDREKKGEVTFSFKFEHIKGTHQVRIEHVAKYTRPTMSGKSSEEFKGATVMHVGRFGKLSIAQMPLPGQGKQAEIPG